VRLIFINLTKAQKGEKIALATHRSAIKRARQNKIRYLRNKSVRTRIKNLIKSVNAAIEEQSAEKARASLAAAIPVIQKAAKKGVIHRKKASRKISRLTRRVNAIAL